MGIYSRGRPQRRQRPATTDELEATIARMTREQAQLAEANERELVIDHAIRTGDVGPIRAWAYRWLPDTSTIDAADDASLLASAREARRVQEAPAGDRERLEAMDEACAAIARDLVAQPPAVRERLIRALERSQASDPLRRELDHLIALQARRLLGAPEGLFA